VRKSEINQKGFTLLELLIAISLLAITAGVTGDIILSLVRSYNKTKITNEIEQGGNAALSKLEKELRVGTVLISPTPGNCSATLSFDRTKTNDPTNSADDVDIQVDYEVILSGANEGSLQRTETPPSGAASTSFVIDSTIPGGVRLDISSGSTTFCALNQSDPYVVQTTVNLLQVATTGGISFQGSVPLEQVIVLRGTY
jgi:prepilin-type N-terminal cleavage/methylation domain-containing protein